VLKPLQLSRICFGCEPLGGTDWGEVDIAKIANAIERALELGINFFDTAAVYGLGLSETRLSEILGPRRHDVVIATKGGLSWQYSNSGGRAVIHKDSSPKFLQSNVEESLRRLRVERLPIFFIHWPDPHTDICETFEGLAGLQAAGKIGSIGCSNFNALQLRQACQVAEISYVQLPLNILQHDLDCDMQQLIHEKNIGVIAYNVLANGLLTGKYGLDAHFLDNDRRSRLPLFKGEAYRQALEKVRHISVISEAQKLSSAQYAIKKVIERPEVVSAILGIKNVRQLNENCTFL
jgi:aryl-alcohol dehydrogenase-like predicted oxidoreductase